MWKYKQQFPEFKIRLVLEALKGEETMPVLASRLGIH